MSTGKFEKVFMKEVIEADQSRSCKKWKVKTLQTKSMVMAANELESDSGTSS